MGRMAKCRVCGAKLDTTTAYKVIICDTNDREKRFYYCSKEEYEADEARKKKEAADKDKVYRLICDILGRKEVVNTALWKEKAVWNKVCTDEVIAQYLEENKDYLTGAISRLDDVEFNRIRYLSAILKNKLGDYKPKVEEERKPVESNSDFELFEPTVVKQNNQSDCIVEDEEDDWL